MNSARSALLAVLSGLLLFASFPPLDLAWLAWVALVPLLIALDGGLSGERAPAPDASPASRAARLGAIAGAVWFLPLLLWMRVFGVLAWVLLAGYLSAYVALFAVGYRWIASGRGPAARIWTAPLLWTGLEYVRSIGVFGFPWALLGLTQHSQPVALQPAAYAGVFGISFLLVLSSAAAAQLLTRRALPAAALPVVLIAVTLGWAAAGLGRTAIAPVLRAAAVQPNVDPREKFDLLAAPEHMRALERLVAASGQEGAELVILPETAIPYNLFGSGGALREVGRWANRARATLIATSLEGGTANIAVSVAPSGQALSRYDKVRLVAFGEYGVTPGRRHEPLWTPSGRVGIAVCFESIFPDVTRALVRNGAELLAVITNDGWFDGTAGVPQHAAHTVLRAVESGRWVVRAANTGRTMVVDPTGRVRGALPLRTAGVLPAQVGLVRTDTFYSRWGDLFSQAVLVALLALAYPRLGAAVAADRRLPAFQQAVAALLLPLVSVYLLIGTRAGWAWPGLLLAFVLVFSAVRPPASWGFRMTRAATSFVMGTAVVVLLWAGLALAFRAYGLPTGLPVPKGGWLAGSLRYLAVALALETWLRGVAFTPLAEWKGTGAAVLVTAAAGVLLQRGLGAEAMAWTLITGMLFGFIRARTGNVMGLVIPHAIGSLLFSMLTLVR